MARLIAGFFLAALTSFPAAAARRTPGGGPEISASIVTQTTPLKITGQLIGTSQLG
jgi:hypothetical protein